MFLRKRAECKVFDQLDSMAGYQAAKAVCEKTVRACVSLTGVGLHTGASVSLTIHPAAARSGILFRRADLLTSGSAEKQSVELEKITIAVHPQAVIRTSLGTSLANEHGVFVNTVEHLLSAFAGMGIDNALVEVHGPEVPIMDGSAEPFIKAIEAVGLRELSAPRQALRILKKIAVKDGDRWIYLTPNAAATDSQCHLDVLVDFEDPSIGRQQAVFDFSPSHFRQSIAQARTFCHASDVALMHERGLALGGSMDNAIVVDKGQVLNEGGLRFDGEFVMHKALDLIGDLYLLGRPLIGQVTAYKPGHDLNTRLVKALVAQPDAWVLEDLREIPAEAMQAEA